MDAVGTGVPKTGRGTGRGPPTPSPTAARTGTRGPVGMPTAVPTTAPTAVPTTVPTTLPTTPTVVCGNTHGQFAGDEYCIEPPPAGQGFQLHYGPADYDDPAEIAKYTINPGGEDNMFVPETSGNTSDVYY